MKPGAFRSEGDPAKVVGDIVGEVWHSIREANHLAADQGGRGRLSKIDISFDVVLVRPDPSPAEAVHCPGNPLMLMTPDRGSINVWAQFDATASVDLDDVRRRVREAIEGTHA